MMRIVDCVQGTPEWHAVRIGIPTASEFKTIIGVKKDARDKVTRRNYMQRIVGEIITGELTETYSNGHMERGKAMEDEARDYYAFTRDVEPQRVGFIINGPKGCSPDSLIGTDGVLEVKTKLPHLMVDCLLKDEFPSEHKAQCQGALWIAEREWVDIACYWPRMPMFVKRARRDEEYIKGLAQAVDEFNAELAEMVERVRRFGESRKEAA